MTSYGIRVQSGLGEERQWRLGDQQAVLDKLAATHLLSANCSLRQVTFVPHQRKNAHLVNYAALQFADPSFDVQKGCVVCQVEDE